MHVYATGRTPLSRRLPNQYCINIFYSDRRFKDFTSLIINKNVKPMFTRTPQTDFLMLVVLVEFYLTIIICDAHLCFAVIYKIDFTEASASA